MGNGKFRSGGSSMRGLWSFFLGGSFFAAFLIGFWLCTGFFDALLFPSHSPGSFPRARIVSFGLLAAVHLVSAAIFALFFWYSRRLSTEIRTREHTEAALTRSEAHYRELVENARTIILRWDTEGRILFLNEYGERLFGWTNAEITGLGVMETIVPALESTGRDLSGMISGLVRNPDAFITNVNENVTRNGRRFWILWKNRPILDDRGNIREILSVGSDITERKQAEATLLEQQRHLDLIINSVPAIIAHVGADQRILLVNRAYCDFHDRPRETVIGHSVREIIRDRGYAASESFIRRVLDGERVEFENRAPDGFGRERDVHITFVPDFDPAGRVTGYFALIQDITERKRAEAERLEMERNLLHTQKLESLGMLAGGIAHDFNNLLTAIMGNLEMARMNLPPESAGSPEMENAIQATRRAADLTRQMLAYAGRGSVPVRPLDLAELVRDDVRMLRSTIPRTVRLVLALAPDLPRILGDAGQVRQVIMNLIINAAEAIGERDGTVTVSTGREACDADRLARSRLEEKATPGPFVVLEVADTGCGMSKETSQRLFDPFFTTKFTGRGLGMSSVLGILRGHRGAIEVESEPGAGTVIRVLFPAVESSFPEENGTAGADFETADRDAPGFALSGAVLVVDDEENVRDTTVRMLQQWGLATLEAADGREAVDRFRAHAGDISLVLLDLTMPRLDGAATFAEIARIRPEARVILCSGYSEQDTRTRFAGMGFAGYLEKPFDMQTLRKELERALGGREKERPESWAQRRTVKTRPGISGAT